MINPRLIQCHINLLGLTMLLAVHGEGKWEKGKSDPDWVKRGPGGQFSKSAGGAADAGKAISGLGADPKEFKDAVKKLTKELDGLDPATVKAFNEIIVSPEMEATEKAITHALFGEEISTAKNVAKAAHAAHGAGEMGKALGMGVIFDFGVSAIEEDMEKMEESLRKSGETEMVIQMAKVSCMAMVPMLLLFSCAAPELLLGATMGEALGIGVAQVGAEVVVTKGGEYIEDKMELDNEMLRLVIKVALMEAAAGSARSAVMKLREGGKTSEKDLQKIEQMIEKQHDLAEKVEHAKAVDKKAAAVILAAGFSPAAQPAMDALADRVIKASPVITPKEKESEKK